MRGLPKVTSGDEYIICILPMELSIDYSMLCRLRKAVASMRRRFWLVRKLHFLGLYSKDFDIRLFFADLQLEDAEERFWMAVRKCVGKGYTHLEVRDGSVVVGQVMADSSRGEQPGLDPGEGDVWKMLRGKDFDHE